MDAKQTIESTSSQVPDFSLVQGGPLYSFFCRLKLSNSYLEFVRRRIAFLVAVTWLPLLILSLISDEAPDVKIPFFYDIQVHVRFLIVLPILIYAEIIVHDRLSNLIVNFTDRGIITTEELPKFKKAVESAMKLRDSAWPEAILFLLVITVMAWTWRRFSFGLVNTWFASVDEGIKHFTVAGNWYAFVSIPIFQFIFFRWGLRYIIFCRLLWQISRLNLRLIPTHPDKTGGMAFLGSTVYATSYVLFALGALLSGAIANRIFFGGQKLTDFKAEGGLLILVAVLLLLLPLTMFTSKLYDAKRKGRREFGSLASRYVQEFEHKWIKGNAPQGEPLIGNPDIQSLADLANSYSTVRDMRLVPFGLDAVAQLILFVLAPMLPLVLTIVPLDKIIEWIFKTLF